MPRLAVSGWGGETRLFLGGLLRALCMRFEDEFSADYAEEAQE